jgi:hypothetical protein
VHYVYAVPRGGTDRGLDKKGTIASSIEAQQRWFERESGGARLRVDTVGGAPDVTFVALPLTIRQFVETDIPPAIRDHLEARGLIKADKEYVVYYEGPPELSACGRGGESSVAVVYLKADCALDQWGSRNSGLPALARSHSPTTTPLSTSFSTRWGSWRPARGTTTARRPAHT